MTPAVELLFDRSALAASPLLARRLVRLPEFPDIALPEPLRAVACRAWEARTRSEYVGVMILRRFHGLLVDLNAPMDLQEAALRMQLEEQQHAALCAEAARSLGSTGAIPFELAELQQARTDAPVTAQLHEMILGTFACGEVTALALVGHTVNSLPEGPYRAVLAHIAADEGLHGRIGPLLLAEMRAGRTADWLPYWGDARTLEFIAAHVDDMRRRAVVEDAEVAAAAAPGAAELLARVGLPEPLAFKAAYMAALDQALPRAFASAGLEIRP